MRKVLLLAFLLIQSHFLLKAQTITIGSEATHNDKFYVGENVSIAFSGTNMTVTPSFGKGEAKTYDVSSETPIVLNANKVEVIQLRHPNSASYGADEGITSYVCTGALDFNDLDGDIKAYIATSNDENSILLAEEPAIKAGEAFVIRGEVGYYCVPTTSTTPSYGNGVENKFLGTTDETKVKTVTSGETNVYALGQYGTFAKIAPSAGSTVTIPIKKAYFIDNSSENPAKSLDLAFEGTEVTAIQNTAIDKSTYINSNYNLAGQEVNSGYKGIIISNGRKYICK